jgi:hypothetical protein
VKMIVARTVEAATEAIAAAAPGDDSRPWSHAADGAPAGADSSAALAAALVAFEADAEAERPDSVLICDDSEPSLAAALVASKLLIPTSALAAARDPATANGRLLVQLTEDLPAPAPPGSTYTPPA